MPPIRVATYNVLSPQLAGGHVAANPLHLTPDFRLALVLTKLRNECALQSVICLQEVSISWLGPLHTFFSAYHYAYIPGMYGKRENGYMGVGIAVPLTHFELLEADVTCISDTKPQPPAGAGVPSASPASPSPSPLSSLLRALFGCCTAPPPAAEESIYQINRKRLNQMVSVRLRQSGDEGAEGHPPSPTFTVSCYHMPCLFKNRPFMSMHCALAAQHAHRFAQGGRYILAGDFNIEPSSPQYKLLTTGVLEGQPWQQGPEFEGDVWAPTVAQPLTSAYAAHKGSEPAFTNYSQRPFMSTPFINT
jgi:hypothetical protein